MIKFWPLYTTNKEKLKHKKKQFMNWLKNNSKKIFILEYVSTNYNINSFENNTNEKNTSIFHMFKI